MQTSSNKMTCSSNPSSKQVSIPSKKDKLYFSLRQLDRRIEEVEHLAKDVQMNQELFEEINREIRHNARSIKYATNVVLVCSVLIFIILLIAWLWR